MNRLAHAVLSALLSVLVVPLFGVAAERPNILFLFADDQRADTISAWGNTHIGTPNIDSLARAGFSFRANYCNGSMGGAVCVPSRAMLNSGRSLFRVNTRLTDTPILPEILGENGYVTFGCGKWHNGGLSFARGFQLGKNVYLGGMSDHFKVPLQDLDSSGGFTNSRIGEGHSSQLFADAAIEFLRSHKGDKPFYCYVAFTAPHDPRDAPKRFMEHYYERRPPLPVNYLPQHPFDNGHIGGRDEKLGPWPRTKNIVSDQLCEYYGLISHLDQQIGRILKTLRDTGNDKNTVIIYAADHGLAVGSHGLLGKQSVYEHSMRCPLIVVGPGIPQGESKTFTYLFDVFTTVCNLSGTNLPDGVEGKDLAPIWRGEMDHVRDEVFLAFAKVMRSVRNGNWKLIRYPQINYSQLFDLEVDPAEMNNLADDPVHAERVREMFGQLTAAQTRYGDSLALTSAKPKPKEVNLTGRSRRPDRWQPKWIREKYFDGN